jgi:hypothetical protein
MASGDARLELINILATFGSRSRECIAVSSRDARYNFVVRRSLWKSSSVLGLVVFLSGGCSNSTAPSGVGISSIAPQTGTTFGGTEVTIVGTNFAAGATVSFGGAPATNVTVESPTRLTAVTGQSPAGTVDVIVAAGGRSATLPRAFTYAPPVLGENTPPTIVSVQALGARTNEPPQFADLGEAITVTAFVRDAETPISQLTFEWTSDVGTFSGGGPVVQWRAPGGGTTPSSATLTVTVIEKYQGADPSGLPVTKENRVSLSTMVSVHDSRTEIGSLARQFLLDFSDSGIRDVGFILRNFVVNDRCPNGKANEMSDVDFNRQHFVINASSIGSASVSIAFNDTCPFRLRSADACAQVPSDWTSTSLDDKTKGRVTGIDQVTAVYDSSRQRWGLCDSDFDGQSATPASLRGFIR